MPLNKRTKAMPRYYFEVSDGDVLYDDVEGEEYADTQAALDAAQRLAGAFSMRSPELAGFTVTVSDELGAVLGEVIIPAPKSLLQ